MFSHTIQQQVPFHVQVDYQQHDQPIKIQLEEVDY